MIGLADDHGVGIIGFSSDRWRDDDGHVHNWPV